MFKEVKKDRMKKSHQIETINTEIQFIEKEKEPNRHTGIEKLKLKKKSLQGLNNRSELAGARTSEL